MEKSRRWKCTHGERRSGIMNYGMREATVQAFEERQHLGYTYDWRTDCIGRRSSKGIMSLRGNRKYADSYS